MTEQQRVHLDMTRFDESNPHKHTSEPLVEDFPPAKYEPGWDPYAIPTPTLE